MIVPQTIKSGLTFACLATLPAYPAGNGWVLQIFLRGPQAIQIQATAKANQHQFNATATTTATWKPGLYAYALRASRDDDVIEVESGQIQILQNLATVPDGTDMRTDNQRSLDSIKAVLANRATKDQQSYTIQGRSLERTPIADLMKLRQYFQNLVNQESRRARGESSLGRTIHVRFGGTR